MTLPTRAFRLSGVVMGYAVTLSPAVAPYDNGGTIESRLREDRRRFLENRVHTLLRDLARLEG